MFLRIIVVTHCLPLSLEYILYPYCINLYSQTEKTCSDCPVTLGRSKVIETISGEDASLLGKLARAPPQGHSHRQDI